MDAPLARGATQTTRAGLWGWMLFDWAAQPFFTVVTTFIFGPYFVSRMASDPATGQAVWGYVDRCPHMGLPLAQVLDDYLTPDGGLIACSWHSALFDMATGQCRGGPCVGSALTPWPVVVEDDRLVTA